MKSKRERERARERDRVCIFFFTVACACGGPEDSSEQQRWLGSDLSFYYTITMFAIQARVRATEAVKSALALRRRGSTVSQPHTRSCPPRYNVHTMRLDWSSGTVRLSTTSGRQSEAQRNWQRAVEARGGVYQLVRTADDMAALVERVKRGEW